MNDWAGAAVLGVVLLIVLRGAVKGADVYAALLRGGRQGMEAAMGLLPALVAMTALLALLSASGLSDALSGILKPVLGLVGLPEEVTTLLLLRPLSGSASLTAMEEVFARCGVDSRAGRIASVLMSASETIFYTLTVYLGATKLKRLPWVIPVSLVSYLAGAAVCGRML